MLPESTFVSLNAMAHQMLFASAGNCKAHSAYTECFAFTNALSHLSITKQDHSESLCLRDVVFNLQQAGCFQAARLAQAVSLQDTMCLHRDLTKKEK